jgi:hypothetical protein
MWRAPGVWHQGPKVHPDAADWADKSDRSLRRDGSYSPAGIFWELPLGLAWVRHIDLSIQTIKNKFT